MTEFRINKGGKLYPVVKIKDGRIWTLNDTGELVPALPVRREHPWLEEIND